MAICSFCANPIKQGTGKMFVYANGKIDYYCSGRCEKQVHKLNKKPLSTKWTETYHREHKKTGKIDKGTPSHQPTVTAGSPP